MQTLSNRPVLGADAGRDIDAVFVNAQLRDYAVRPRINNFTLPVLGMGYIATYAKNQGFNVGILDAEALGLGIDQTAQIINEIAPRWVGFNLLAPTYEISANIAARLDKSIQVMVGGHHAKAMPKQALSDQRFSRCEALVIGEGETRVVELLKNSQNRLFLPQVMWKDHSENKIMMGTGANGHSHLSPKIDDLPFIDRDFLVDDPYLAIDGRREANMVGARGCPYNCSFCGAAVSANPDVTIRTRSPLNLIEEMSHLHEKYDVTAFRFVDDLFLGYERFILSCMESFQKMKIGDSYVWDATGRINILHRMEDDKIDLLKRNGCREIALGIESGSDRLLRYMGKRITAEMARSVVRRLTQHGISVKGYFILGYPTESRSELLDTVQLIRDLWEITTSKTGNFRASIFEFRPYPGTPEWQRLLQKGDYKESELLNYNSIDLTNGGVDSGMLQRDEFNFSVNIQFGEARIDEIRSILAELSREQFERSSL